MVLTPGDKLGHYEGIALLAKGGMGEVYRARDTKLKRDVALKVLPAAFAGDPRRMARFQREAEVPKSTVEERAVAMELVEGESPKGPLPFDEAWKIALRVVVNWFGSLKKRSPGHLVRIKAGRHHGLDRL